MAENPRIPRKFTWVKIKAYTVLGCLNWQLVDRFVYVVTFLCLIYCKTFGIVDSSCFFVSYSFHDVCIYRIAGNFFADIIFGNL